MEDMLLFSSGKRDPKPVYFPSSLGTWRKDVAEPAAPVQRLSSLARGIASALPFGGSGSTSSERRKQRVYRERKQILQLRMANAETYDEWEAAAIALDKLDGHEAWKMNDESDDHYNPDLIASRLHALENARIIGDVPRMLHLVRTALSRDVGGISSANLYNHSHVGTKKLVERYVKASADLVYALVEKTARSLPEGLTHREILDSLLLARKSFGRSALVLSGGAVYGMAHIGVLKALHERSLLPRIISGTSAGSIVAAVVCTKTDEEIPLVLERFAQVDLAVFTDKEHPDSWITHVMRALRYGTWHDSRHLSRVMRNMLGDMTFQEAFNRTRRTLNITVSSKPGLHLPPLLNYMTAPNVIVWSAVVASCSVPGVFNPQPLLVRDDITGEHIPWDPAEQLWIDGSLDNDVPVERLGEMLSVNHFIVSQTNPHIVLFVSKDEKKVRSDDYASSHVEQFKQLVYTLAWLGKSEVVYCLENLIETGIFKGSLSMLVKMLNQKYTADINILPRMSLLEWGPHIIRNPTPEFMVEACRAGEQATWPSLCRIEQACAVELALDRAVHILRERVAFSDSQVNLRRLITGSTELGLLCNDAAKAAAYKHIRRGSGGSIQLSARKRRNRDELETILSEDGHDSDPESKAPSLAARRGIEGMTLSSILDEYGKLPPYRGPIKQNSLQQLPVARSPSASPSTSRKPAQGYGFGAGALTPFTRITDEDMSGMDDADEAPVLSMKPSRRRSSPRLQTAAITAAAAATEARMTKQHSPAGNKTPTLATATAADIKRAVEEALGIFSDPGPYDEGGPIRFGGGGKGICEPQIVDGLSSSQDDDQTIESSSECSPDEVSPDECELRVCRN